MNEFQFEIPGPVMAWKCPVSFTLHRDRLISAIRGHSTQHSSRRSGKVSDGGLWPSTAKSSVTMKNMVVSSVR